MLSLKAKTLTVIPRLRKSAKRINPKPQMSPDTKWLVANVKRAVKSKADTTAKMYIHQTSETVCVKLLEMSPKKLTLRMNPDNKGVQMFMAIILESYSDCPLPGSCLHSGTSLFAEHSTPN